MKLFHKSKDGGPDSNVTGYWLIESKSLFSIVLLRFDKGTREAFHTHAFNAVSWVLRGRLLESARNGEFYIYDYFPSFRPIYTAKERMHQVEGIAKTTWALSFRGPWDTTWKEYLPEEDKEIVLTNGRKVLDV